MLFKVALAVAISEAARQRRKMRVYGTKTRQGPWLYYVVPSTTVVLRTSGGAAMTFASAHLVNGALY